MKKTLKSLVFGLVLAAGVSASMAQDGNINFATFNNNPAKGKVSLPASLGGGGAIGPTYVGQLYGGVSSGSLSPIGTAQAFSTAVPGYISATPSLVTATGSAPGDSYFYALRAWDAASGSYATAVTSGVWGSSATVSVVLGGTDAFGGFFTTPTANGFASFTLTANSVPEPTTLALAGLGVAALLVARRRK